MNNFPLVGGSVFSISAIFMACVFNVSKHFGVAVNWNFGSVKKFVSLEENDSFLVRITI